MDFFYIFLICIRGHFNTINQFFKLFVKQSQLIMFIHNPKTISLTKQASIDYQIFNCYYNHFLINISYNKLTQHKIKSDK